MKKVRGIAAKVVLVAVPGSLVALASCNVSSSSHPTGGVDIGPSGAGCPSALSIMASDYKSTDIAVSGLDGTTMSGDFVSSGSALPGLTLALSGDVDVPFVPPVSGRVVVIDRYGTDVITWMNLAKATVLAQLAIGTGFDSNPQDYVEVDSTRAFVSRYGSNPTPGQQANDQGGDLLVVDTSQYAITGRIAMPEENPALLPSPAGMNWLGKDVVVTLQRFSADFTQIGDGRFVGVSPQTNAVAWTVNIAGLQNCGRVVVSPSGKTAAIACSSMADPNTGAYDPTKSDIVVYDATQSPPVETKRLGLGATLNAGLQPQIAFADEDQIVALTYGGNATAYDTVFAVSASTAAVTPLGQSTMPFVLGGVYCTPGCGDDCVLADAEQNALRRWHVSGGTFTSLDNAPVDPSVGLPPRDIGALL